jgi:hypothetical protein
MVIGTPTPVFTIVHVECSPIYRLRGMRLVPAILAMQNILPRLANAVVSCARFHERSASILPQMMECSEISIVKLWG